MAGAGQSARTADPAWLADSVSAPRRRTGHGASWTPSPAWCAGVPMPPESVASDGQPGVLLSVSKKAGTNTLGWSSDQ
jgi:hypothetical protein